MGDRHYIKLNCAWCGKENPKPRKDIPFPFADFLCYGESCGNTDFRCDYCGKKNDIKQGFSAVKKVKIN